jgi:hypothetical protein
LAYQITSQMTVSEDAWYDEANASLPRAMCFADTNGGHVGVAAKQQLFNISR